MSTEDKLNIAKDGQINAIDKEINKLGSNGAYFENSLEEMENIQIF